MSSIINVNGSPAVVLDASDVHLLDGALPVAGDNDAQALHRLRSFYQDDRFKVIRDVITEIGALYEASAMPDMPLERGTGRDSDIGGSWWSTARAAKVYSVDVSTVRRWVRAEKLVARRRGHTVEILAGQQSPTSFEVAAKRQKGQL